MNTAYPPAKSPALALAMASVGPAPEWAWLDYLSPGDVARVALLRQIQRESDTPDDVREAARTAHNILREIAGWRTAEAPSGPSFSMSAEAMSQEVAACFAETAKTRAVAPGETVKPRWTLDEIKAAWLQAQETGRPEGARARSADDLENSWSHLRNRLLFQRV